MNPPFLIPANGHGLFNDRRRWLTGAMRTSLSVSLAGVGLKAAAQAGNPGPTASSEPRGPGARGDGRGGEYLDRLLNRLLDGLDVTPEQRSRLQALALRNRQEMEAGRAPRQALRERALAEWAKPQLDTSAIEQLRAQQVKLHEDGSRRMTALLMEAANVLNPTQRAQVVQRLQQMPLGRGPGGQGGMSGPGGMMGGPR